MAETEGGATQGAEIQEKAKAPEVERISNERVGLTTRLLLGGEAFNPAKTDIKDLKESDPLNKLGASLYLVNKISGAERKAHWESTAKNI